MYFPPATAIALPAFVRLAYAAPPSLPRDDSLLPWSVTNVESSSPGDRSTTTVYNTINVTVTDPNTISINGTSSAVYSPSTADCIVKWTLDGDPPWGVARPCISPVERGEWVYWLEQIASANIPATEAFGMKLTRVAQETYDGIMYTKIFDGNAAFSTGISGNLDGTCDVENNCLWQLKDRKPVEILQTARASATA